MRVLVIDEWLPLPLISGKKIRTFQLLSPLAARHEITYLCYADAQAEAEKVVQMQKAGIRVVCVPPVNRFRTPARLAAGLALNLCFPTPLVVRKHYSHRFRRAIEEILAKKSFDVVHCEWTHYAQYVPLARHLPKFLSSHNIENMQWRRFAEVQTSPLRKAAIHLEWLKMRAFERRAVVQFDHVAAVSAEDAEIMRSLGAGSVQVIPNGVDTAYYEQSSGGNGEQTMVYCASMDAFVNQDAAVYFVKSILPRIRAKKPQARFVILGRCPPASIRKLASDQIIVSGTVDDVRPLLGKATVSVVPLRIAGGSRLKILESFAAGIPVVSTTIGAEGLGLKHGTQLLIADDEPSFAAECVHLLEQPDLRAKLVRTARSHVEDRHDWKAIAPLVEDAWERAARNFSGRKSQKT